ncbi:YwmB family TATA-box binding protein [Lacrimispora sp. NSJ-141]|uniref:YwmB family TATA-box binding protein n=1 Tax=Lientehia hominis TaxID=2897778 RepID=A0AAP2W9X9_9FIRM|nr:YwmB family TATA-box binding protein [Lientehia hominis]MCD2492264.1 YwmB family TATA-box binding protein [Lientehia hominis]
MGKGLRKAAGKWKLCLLGMLLLAVAVLMFRGPDTDVRETVLTAFEKANFSDSSCHIYREGYLDDAYYLIEEKKTFLENLTDKLNTQGMDAEAGETESRRISQEHLKDGNSITLEQTAGDGSSVLRLSFLTREEEISPYELRQENYLRADIYLQGQISAEKALKGQKRLDEATAGCGLEEQVYVEMEGSYEGRLSREEQGIIVESLLDEMNAEQVEEMNEEELYTVYAYAKGAGEAKSIAGRNVNLNLAVSYDEQENKTIFHLGCPIIRADY